MAGRQAGRREGGWMVEERRLGLADTGQKEPKKKGKKNPCLLG